MSLQDMLAIQAKQFNDANCLGMDTEIFFRGTDEEQEKNAILASVCADCPVFEMCRKEADKNLDQGWRAGTSSRQRSRARRNAAKKESATASRAPRVQQLKAQGLSNVNIARSMNLSVHAVDKTVRFLKDIEAAA